MYSVDLNGNLCSTEVELMLSQYVLQPQQINVCSQSHLAHAVCVEVKLILNYFSKMLHSQTPSMLLNGSSHPHIHAFHSLFSRTIWVNRHQNNKPFWIVMQQQIMWWQWHQLTTCKSHACCSRQIRTMPAPHHHSVIKHIAAVAGAAYCYIQSKKV